jgi:uncharacterized protein (DUF2336 family)
VKAFFPVEGHEPAAIVETPCWAVRAKDADRLATRYAEGGLGAAERREAEQAFRWLRYDGEVWVRRIVADALKAVEFLPPDIALLYAGDLAEVAVPVIEHSPVLRERDLLSLLRDHPGEHRAAIARRPALPARVAEAISRSGESAAVRALLANADAEIPMPALRFLLDRRGEWPGVAQAVARRLLDRARGDEELERRSKAEHAFRQLVRAVDAGETAAVALAERSYPL